jgi:hypothetical protein
VTPTNTGANKSRAILAATPAQQPRAIFADVVEPGVECKKNRRFAVSSNETSCLSQCSGLNQIERSYDALHRAYSLLSHYSRHTQSLALRASGQASTLRATQLAEGAVTTSGSAVVGHAVRRGAGSQHARRRLGSGRSASGFAQPNSRVEQEAEMDDD